MALATNSYGSVAGVQALTPLHLSAAGDFTPETRPTKAQVETWLDEVSSLLNMALADNGFSIPVTQADALRMLAHFANAEVASLVEGINGHGRFGPKSKGARYNMLTKDVFEWLEDVASGMASLGATRSSAATTAGMAFRQYDEAGDAVEPLFQRKAYEFDVILWDE